MHRRRDHSSNGPKLSPSQHSTTSLRGPKLSPSQHSTTSLRYSTSFCDKAAFDDSPRARPFTSNRSLASSDELTRDYKKLYEDEKSENMKLKTRVNELEAEIKASKSERKALAEVRPTDYDNSDSFTARREKRLLERKLAELEEELKKMESLKEANQRLKHENGALIRVISKLSK